MKFSSTSSKATKSIVTKFDTEPPGVEKKKICANNLGHMTNMATKFYTEPPGVEKKKICANNLGHMTNMATTPRYD